MDPGYALASLVLTLLYMGASWWKANVGGDKEKIDVYKAGRTLAIAAVTLGAVWVMGLTAEQAQTAVQPYQGLIIVIANVVVGAVIKKRNGANSGAGRGGDAASVVSVRG